MTSQNQMAVYAFLMNTAYNMWMDTSNEDFMKKLGRAALNSVPITLALDTRDLVNYAAKKMGVKEVQQPKTSLHSMNNTVYNVTKTLEEFVAQRNMPAYYSKPGEEYKNFE